MSKKFLVFLADEGNVKRCISVFLIGMKNKLCQGHMCAIVALATWYVTYVDDGLIFVYKNEAVRSRSM